MSKRIFDTAKGEFELTDAFFYPLELNEIPEKIDIKGLMMEKGYTKSEMAKEIGISIQHLINGLGYDALSYHRMKQIAM